MKLKIRSAWIFTMMLLGLVLVLLFPTPNFIAFGIIFLPALLIAQVVLILQSNEFPNSDKTFEDWYENE
ncbi:MAG: hypothetical protein AAF705_15035 [Bacteroidota bacterium]